MSDADSPGAAHATGPGEGEPIRDEPVTAQVTSSTVEFAGRVWDIRRESFAFGDGTIARDFVDHTGAVAVLALDEEDRVLLIQQYRHPVRQRDWELPAGLLDLEGEDPVVAAQRELAEEVDLVATDWAVLSDLLVSPGGSNEVIRIFLARGLTPTAEVFDRTEEEAEIALRWLSLDEAVEAVLERRIQNSILCVAVLAADAARARDWRTLGPADAPWPQHPRNRR